MRKAGIENLGIKGQSLTIIETNMAAQSFNSNPWVIGICGGSGAGKSHVVNSILRSSLKDSICSLSHDAYYKDFSTKTFEERCAINWDHPDALDNGLLAEQIFQLKQRQTIDYPVYDFASHSRLPHTLRLEPKPIILLDGILIFAVPEIEELLDYKIFVDLPPEVRLARRIKRDAVERDRDAESVRDQYKQSVQPMHDLFVEPTKKKADLIIQGRDNEFEIASLIETLKKRIDRSN